MLFLMRRKYPDRMMDDDELDAVAALWRAWYAMKDKGSWGTLEGVMPGQGGRCPASLAPTVTRQTGEAEGEQRQAGGFGDGILFLAQVKPTV
jgi:hypothetical protein